MKRVLRHYVINSVTLYLISMLTEGIILEKGIESLLLAGVGITLVYMLIKPLINLLLLPINLITFGLFRWVSSAVALYLVTLVVPGFKITRFFLAGFSTQWFDIPTISLGGILSFVAFSLLISLLSSFLLWLVK
ncbi:MAG: phage holin family protein [bacterium]